MFAFLRIKMYQIRKKQTKGHNKISKIELKHIYDVFMSFPQTLSKASHTKNQNQPKRTQQQLKIERKEKKYAFYIWFECCLGPFYFCFHIVVALVVAVCCFFFIVMCSAVTCMRYYMNSILFNPLLHWYLRRPSTIFLFFSLRKCKFISIETKKSVFFAVCFQCSHVEMVDWDNVSCSSCRTRVE